jgi:hypothetical protein
MTTNNYLFLWEFCQSLKLETERIPELLNADLVGGKKRLTDDVMYYDFDLAIAPKTCQDNAAENLGLGFCPYDRVGKKLAVQRRRKSEKTGAHFLSYDYVRQADTIAFFMHSIICSYCFFGAGG